MSQISDPFSTALSAITAAEQQHQADQATIAQQTAQIAALNLQLATANYPASPAPISFAPVKTYCVSATGHDNPSSDGTQAKPYATIDYALSQVNADRAAGASGLAEISLDGQGKTDWREKTQTLTDYVGPSGGQGWFSQNNILFRSYNGIAKITALEIALGHGAASSSHQYSTLYVSRVKLVQAGGQTTNLKAGIFAESTDDLIVDHCWIEGFTFGVDITWQCTGWKVRNCFILKSQPYCGSNGQIASQGAGLYVEGSTGGDLQGSVFYRNGISTDPTIYPGAGFAAQMFFHGVYDSTAANNQPLAVNRFNFFGVNASTGFQGRTGGKAEYFVCQCNGTAWDIFENGNSGELANFALFGDTGTTDFWFAGGGAFSTARAASIHDGVVLSASTQTKGAAVQIGAADTAYSTTLPVSAAVTNVRGVWQNNDQGPNDVYVDPGRTSSTTITNVSIRRPNAGEKVPSLMDYCGTASDEETFMAIGVGTLNDDPKYSAQAILAWANQQVP